MKRLSLEINIAHEYQVGAVILIWIANNRVIFILISIEKGICLAYRENKLNECLSSILIAFHYANCRLILNPYKPQNAASDQGLHCLLTENYIKIWK